MAAVLFAVDPVGLGGVVLRSAAGDRRDRWLGALKGLLPAGALQRRVPLHVHDDRLIGGLDLAATLQAGRPIALRGLLAEADGGIVLLAMAERVGAATAAAVCAVMDSQEIVVERHGIGTRSASRFGVVALDEGAAEDEQVPSRLRERLAFHLLLEPSAGPQADTVLFTREDIAAARLRLDGVRISDDIVEGLCAASLALGVDSSRATLFACRAARVAAALDGRMAVSADDAALAAALVLAPRATRLPAAEPPGADHAAASEAECEPGQEELDQEASGPDADTVASDDAANSESDRDQRDGLVDDVILEAALAAIPRGLLASIALGRAHTVRGAAAGRAGALQLSKLRGRPLGSRRSGIDAGARLNLIETLRHAAPWQLLRRREAAERGELLAAVQALRIQVRREDFRVWRFKQRSETTTIFVVDASGSSALHRLAETKGAVELLLADCYVRRDSVAVIAFRGSGAELLLSPTRSLVRAKRSLAGLPGGGGTPLAAGIAAACTLVEAVRRKGATPVVVLLTDGRANVARDGSPGRARANEESLAVARQMQVMGVASLLLDTSPQPQDSARLLADAMGARYLPLPHAGAAAMSNAVRAAGQANPAAW